MTVNLLSEQALAMNLCISSVVLNVQSTIVDVDTWELDFWEQEIVSSYGLYSLSLAPLAKHAKIHCWHQWFSIGLGQPNCQDSHVFIPYPYV